MTIDEKFMHIAISYAERGLGTTAPNPSVGCVIVRDGHIISAAHTARGGRPHAETIALAEAGSAASGADMYVTLEPCCHTGQTPPCTDAIIKAGIKRVIIANGDPFHMVAGGGISILKYSNIEVVSGVLSEEAFFLNRGFFNVQTKNRPLVTLKLATSMDEKIAGENNQQIWLTGEKAKRYVHMLRAKYDAILVGSGTVFADNPMLTCRIAGLEDRSPIRVIIEGLNIITDEFNIIKTATDIPTWIISSNRSRNSFNGERVFACGDKLPDLQEALQILAENGITRLFVEGGNTIATSLVEQNLVDEIIWIKAPKTLGDRAVPALSGIKLSNLAESERFFVKNKYNLDDDIVVHMVQNA